MAQGKVKSVWGLDWPARWAKLNVDAEPFGREHATKGGSYETGARLIKAIFGAEPPFPVPYETINLVGQTKKMSSSLGNLVSLTDALEIIPPEVLRYFVIRSRPDRKLMFDPGIGLYNLIDEYANAESNPKHEFRQAYEFAKFENTESKRVVSSVPFSHLVQVYQAAQANTAQALATISRTGYPEAAKTEADLIKKELGYIKNWLGKYAPAEVKFTIQTKLPKVELSPSQRDFLRTLADKVEQAKVTDGQWFHDGVYELKEQFKLEPSDAFKAIYRVLLGQDYGPKAGWFLASLDKNWLIKRLKLEA